MAKIVSKIDEIIGKTEQDRILKDNLVFFKKWHRQSVISLNRN